MTEQQGRCSDQSSAAPGKATRSVQRGRLVTGRDGHFSQIPPVDHRRCTRPEQHFSDPDTPSERASNERHERHFGVRISPATPTPHNRYGKESGARSAPRSVRFRDPPDNTFESDRGLPTCNSVTQSAPHANRAPDILGISARESDGLDNTQMRIRPGFTPDKSPSLEQ